MDTGIRAHRHDGGSSEDRWAIPVLSARRDGFAERFASSLGRFHPIMVFMAAMLAGLVALAGLSIGLGFLVTRVLLHAWGLGASDERVEVWLANHRTPARTHASLIGSIISGGVVLPIVVASIAVACVVLRKWRIAAFVVFVLAVESASYRATTLLVHRPRPSVARLEHLPVNASYPSGHTAAAIAVYAGIVLLLTSRMTNRVFRALAWTIALAIPTFVAWSRLYRGMHHPFDVAGGVVVGVGAVIVLVFACRAAGTAAESRQ